MKEELLKRLIDNKNTYISGEKLAEELEVSRNSIWKIIQQLQKEGYVIEAIRNKGYQLKEEKDVLSVPLIESYLKEKRYRINLEKKVTSTNTVLKTLAEKNIPEWTTLVAEEQTMGRGRSNREFYSPKTSGIYFSIVLRPKNNLNNPLFITTSAAVSVKEAIEEVCKVPCGIKWVNDIYCENKKVCGILTEASLNCESLQMDYVVLGIGINIASPENAFPDEIKDIARGIFTKVPTELDNVRSKLLASILDHFAYYYDTMNQLTFLKKYQDASMLTGKKVTVIKKEGNYVATVKRINDQCELVLERSDNTEEVLSSGEVSVHLVK